MFPLKVIERAEKYSHLMRFDRNSAVSYMNDAMYEIAMRSSFEIEQEVTDYTGGVIQANNELIRLVSITIEGSDDYDSSFGARSDHKGRISITRDGVPLEDNGIVIFSKVGIKYIGYPKIDDVEDVEDDTEIDFPEKYETAIAFYIRSKMLEEMDSIEKSLYFHSKYLEEMRLKVSPPNIIIPEPSKYSLL